MTTNTNGTAVKDVHLTRAQIVSRLASGAKERLGMTAKEMVTAFKHGKLEDPGAVADLLGLASLLKKNDPLFVGF